MTRGRVRSPQPLSTSLDQACLPGFRPSRRPTTATKLWRKRSPRKREQKQTVYPERRLTRRNSYGSCSHLLSFTIGRTVQSWQLGNADNQSLGHPSHRPFLMFLLFTRLLATPAGRPHSDTTTVLPMQLRTCLEAIEAFTVSLRPPTFGGLGWNRLMTGTGEPSFTRLGAVGTRQEAWPPSPPLLV